MADFSSRSQPTPSPPSARPRSNVFELICASTNKTTAITTQHYPYVSHTKVFAREILPEHNKLGSHSILSQTELKNDGRNAGKVSVDYDKNSDGR